MNYMQISLHTINERLPKTRNEAVLQCYIRDVFAETENGLNQRNPAIVLCPGGGYHFTSNREAEPVALQFTAAGFNVFIIRYSCAPDRYPAQLLQVAAVIAYIRDNAAQYHVDENRIAVCGFSAGGHLAASAGILWKESVITDTLGIPYGRNKPNAMILGYPVISGICHPHLGSFKNLLGEDAQEASITEQSLETRVDSDTVPAFIWHTFDDAGVPVENSLDLARSLRAFGVPFEMHIYPKGPHGLSLCTRQTANAGRPDLISPHVATWMPLCIEWLEGLPPGKEQ